MRIIYNPVMFKSDNNSLNTHYIFTTYSFWVQATIHFSSRVFGCRKCIYTLTEPSIRAGESHPTPPNIREKQYLNAKQRRPNLLLKNCSLLSLPELTFIYEHQFNRSTKGDVVHVQTFTEVLLAVMSWGRIFSITYWDALIPSKY